MILLLTANNLLQIFKIGKLYYCKHSVNHVANFVN